ncbi:Uncharacterised protein [Mycobacteroides abscessus subsp. abscessus]|nr:Uncharacterised protein [Mycobacteroides abscessus subsp. abscessus]
MEHLDQVEADESFVFGDEHAACGSRRFGVLRAGHGDHCDACGRVNGDTLVKVTFPIP